MSSKKADLGGKKTQWEPYTGTCGKRLLPWLEV